MSDKITLQSIAESFSRACGVQKKVAEQLSRSFFDVIAESLSAGTDSVRINGLGTFRIVEVSPRESINVTNGERIVIAGYKKVSFTPEDGLMERLLNATSAPDDDSDAADEDDAVPSSVIDADTEGDTDAESEDESDSNAVAGSEDDDAVAGDITGQEEIVDEINDMDDKTEDIDEVEAAVDAVDAPSHVEVKENEFSGIDMLISTPESVEEIREQLDAARADAEEKLQAAKDAHREVLRLEALLEHIENSVLPENPESQETPDTTDATEVLDVQESQEDTDAQVEPTESADAEPVVLPTAAASVKADDTVIAVEIPEPAEPVQQEETEIPEASVQQDEPVIIDEEPALPVEAVQQDEEPAQPVEAVLQDDESTQAIEVVQQEVSVPQEESAEQDNTEETAGQEQPSEASISAEPVSQPEVTEQAETAEQPEATEQPVQPVPTDPKQEALNRYLSGSSAPEINKKDGGSNHSVLWWILIPLIVLVVGIAVIFIVRSGSDEQGGVKQLPVEPHNGVTTPKKQQTPAPQDTATMSAPATNDATGATGAQPSSAQGTDASAYKAAKTATGTANATAASSAKSKAPKTHVMANNENLTRISQKYYGTKDSVRAIIRLNKFKDPDNVPVGTEIKLP